MSEFKVKLAPEDVVISKCIDEATSKVIADTAVNGRGNSYPFQKRIAWSILSSCMLTAAALILNGDRDKLNQCLKNSCNLFSNTNELQEYIDKLVSNLSSDISITINHTSLYNIVSAFIKTWNMECWYNDDTYPKKDIRDHIQSSIYDISSYLLNIK